MSGLLQSGAAVDPVVPGAIVRPATMGEVWDANRVLARGDRTDAEAERLRREYEPLLAAVNADRQKRGLKPMVNPGFWQNPMMRRPSADNGTFDLGSLFDKRVDRESQERAIFGEIASIRQRDPAFLKDAPADLATFRKGVIDREKAARANARGVLDRSSGFAQGAVGFAAGTWETMHDPVNIASLPLGGGGGTIWAQAARSALVNGGLELIQQPIVAGNREDLGEELTLGEAGLNTLMGAAGGVVGDVVIPQLGKAVIKGIGQAVDALKPLDRKIASALARADLDGVSDSDIAGMFGRHVPGDVRTPDESAAIHVIEREAEIRASSPYADTPEGMDAHAARMQATLEALVRTNTPEAMPIAAAAAPAKRPKLRTSGGRLANDVVGFFQAKGYSEAQARGIAAGIAAEAASNHGAVNPTSGAFGLGQWLGSRKAELFRRYGRNPTRQQQLEFLHWELQGGDHGGAAVLRAGNEAAVLDAYVRKFMRPAAGGETTGDLSRGMAALGREGEDIAGADAVFGDMDVDIDAPIERPAAMDAERATIDGPDLEIDYADLPQLRRDMFEDEASWLAAQQQLVDAAFDGAVIAPRARPVRRASMDLMQFIASKGGLIDNEGHDLKGMFDGARFVPGIGTLVRRTGMALDRARELAVEAGYFGDPRRTDVTTADLLDALDRQHRGGERTFVPSDLAEVEARRRKIQQSEDFAEFDQRLRNAASERGIDDLVDDDSLRAYELWDGDFEETLDRVIGEQLDQAHMDFLAESDPTLYAQLQQAEELGYGARRPEDGSDPGWAEEPSLDAGNPRQDGTRLADGGSAAAAPRAADHSEELRAPSQELMARWDDPSGEASRLQADSLDHDMRQLVDPSVAERQRQATQLRAEAPLQGSAKTGKEQDGTMGLGLFDAADQPAFRLEDGSEASLADILTDLDEDEAMLATIRSCL
ncbi:hypothetical protein FIM10_01800 [Sphingomonadales bacterium 56]|uniref:phage tail tip lysozyme n=1 Tax=unclassified Sphingobium TaxID=2611147 RepID=UPI0019184F40|nr:MULTISPECIES: phage tail tip lysozyme [unclassified Sphingobium]MBY2927417.1 hypothetical protein [Sphingomonadales bacterium 56]MBY2957485.1 hypothetical protein [Sphingomonadales bacterium 58]MBY2957528.1 hypothetical protein [Sphingomonadales bacterium 58]CAD7335149.1 hypothetical protein SPHS8_00362 [Sphingobium sp. S8]CAD7335168.1 hypothetical protein SPHS6_00362 [Sphingobium sp. S6]